MFSLCYCYFLYSYFKFYINLLFIKFKDSDNSFDEENETYKEMNYLEEDKKECTY